jgi:prevent-host-death family protein
MDQDYSIAEAKDNFSSLVHEAEGGRAVPITRRGRAVARLISEAEYQRLIGKKPRMDWGAVSVDTRGFKFDRDEANER